MQTEKARREREAEFIQQLVRREKEIRRAEEELAETPEVSVLPYIGQHTVCKSKKQKAKKPCKIKATEVKLCCEDKVKFDNVCYDNAKK